MEFKQPMRYFACGLYFWLCLVFDSTSSTTHTKTIKPDQNPTTLIHNFITTPPICSIRRSKQTLRVWPRLDWLWLTLNEELPLTKLWKKKLNIWRFLKKNWWVFPKPARWRASNAYCLDCQNRRIYQTPGEASGFLLTVRWLHRSCVFILLSRGWVYSSFSILSLMPAAGTDCGPGSRCM